MKTATTVAHARRPRADPRASDGRRLFAAVLSAILPGLGQAFNGRWRAALVFGVPSLVLIGVTWLLLQLNSPTMLLARAIVPSNLQVLLILNWVLLGWRMLSALEAFVDRRYPARPGRLGGIGLLVLMAAAVLPHLLAHAYGTIAASTFERVFAGALGEPTGGPDDDAGSTAGPTPGPGERINVLLMGIDSGPRRTQALTDSLIVVSLDPVGRTATMLSIPRDLVDVPLSNGDTYGPKINSLLGWANRHDEVFPEGGTRALEDAVGAMLDIPIHYYAKVDLAGFVTMVDAVGGVDVDVERPLADPKYGGFGVGPGWSITAGPHHLDGPNALAYARIRKSNGESDFTRAARQQQVLVAIRDQAVASNLLVSLPGLLDAVGDSVRTDVPAEMLPELAAFAEEIGGDRTTRAVMTSPMVKSGGKNHRYGSVVVPVPKRIAEMVAVIFPEPGTAPGEWPPPKAR
jgi:LCP family protein required for cell wall assembly